MEYIQKHWKLGERIEVAKDLPLIDYYIAPCVTACAIKQDIPEYIRLLGEHRYADALELTYQRNALPAITGHACDHQCQYNCTRLDYDSALNIRGLEKVALEKDWEEYKQRWHEPAGSGSRHPVVVIGAGPAGLVTGHFLARAGHPVTLFEHEANASDVVKNIIPQFRVPAELIQHDIDPVVGHGVKFEYGCSPDLTVEQLENQGFHYVLATTSTDKSSGVKLAGGNQDVWKSFPFLCEYNKDTILKLDKHVVVIGTDNTAMDYACAASCVPSIEKATVAYRRSLQEMPVWREEYKEALHNDVEFRFLNSPECFDVDGVSTLRVMSLGEPDKKGHRHPIEINETVTLHVDSLITIAGKRQDTEALNAMDVLLDKDGWLDVDHNGETRLSDISMIGGVQHGPSSIVAAVGAARRVTDTILSWEDIRSHQNGKYWSNVNPTGIYQREGDISVTLVNSDDRDTLATQEAARCLGYNYVCSECVGVYLDRANVPITVPGFQNCLQTLHFNAYCNECGNCTQFYSWNDEPYRDKITVLSLSRDFNNSSNLGFFVEDCRMRVRPDNQSRVLNIDNEGQSDNVSPKLNDICRITGRVHQHHHYLLSCVEV